MLQVMPDWEKKGTKKQLEEYISEDRISISGPGFYLTNTDTILIVKNEEDDSFTPSSNEETVYMLYCWNAPINRTIFGCPVIPPVRSDERE